jgi:ComF family protein
MWQILKALSEGVGEALFKPNCGLCGKPCDGFVCASCDRALQSCKADEPVQTEPRLPKDSLLFAWGIYEQSLKQAIARCKYENQPRIALHLGQKIGDRWQSHPHCQAFMRRQGQLPVIPIPMHADKLKVRGFNQAEELAKGFCRITHLPHRPHWLERIKNTKPQMETKSKAERQENLHQAFRPQIPANQGVEAVILLDDIYTTGATIREAMTALESAGVKTAAIVVLARPHFQVTYNKKAN